MSAALVFASILVIVLTGCSTLSPGPATQSAKSEPKPETCGDFLKLSAAKRVSTYAHSKRVRTYDASGVEHVSEDKIYSRDCLNLDSSDLLDNPLINAGAPDCSLYQTLPPDVQNKWLDAIETDQYYSLGSPASGPQLVEACKVFDAGNMIAASNYIKSYGSFMYWDTTSKLGYQEHLVLGVLPVAKGKDIVHPNDDKFTAGSACGFDSSKDAAIPLLLFVRNSTKTESQAMGAKFLLDVVNVASLSTNAYLETRFSDGPVCSQAASVYGSNATVAMKFTDVTKAGASVQSAIFVIVKNYFSPRYPTGAASELASYRLRSDAQVNTDDPIVESTPATMNLDGSK